MRLRSITLRNFRGVNESTVTFSEGVTVIVGPNEVGKSSIPEAIGLLREMKASSRHRRVTAVQPVHRDLGPEVELSLATGAYELTYRKRWIRQATTELQIDAPRREQLTGDEAHDRFLAILNETCDMDLLVALELVQGTSLLQPQLAQVGSLQRALDGSAGEFVSHDELMERIEQEYERYFTRTGRETGEYRALAEKRGGLADEVARLEAQSEQMDQFTLEHQEVSAELAVIGRKLKESEQSRQELESAAEELTALRDAVTLAERALDDQVRRRGELRAALDARRELVEEVDQRAQSAERLAAEAALSEEQESRARHASDAARAALTEAEDARKEARRTQAETASKLNRLRDRGELTGAVRRLEQATETDERRRLAAADAETIGMDAALLSRLEELDNRLQVADGVRSAAAPSVSVAALGVQPVVVDGVSLTEGEGRDWLISDPVTVEVEGVVRVQVLPGETPSDLDQAWRHARDDLDLALTAAGVDSVVEARELFERRQRAQVQVSQAEAALELLLQGVSLDSLRDQVSLLHARLGETPEEDEGREAVEREAVAAQAGLAEAESALDGAREAAEKCGRRFEDARVAQAQLAATTASAQSEARRVAQRLDAAREVHPDAHLEAAVAEAAEQVARAREHLETCQAALSDAEPEALEMRLTNARQLVERALRERDQAATRITELGALLEDRATQGIYDALANARAALENTRTRYARLHRLAQAVRLLRETMTSHRAASQQSYVAPFRERIERLGRVVFGSDFSVEVSTDLMIVSRTLNGITVPFESLSSGAKEQLALLGRLACAQLVDQEDGAPVILDDALGFADPTRLNALGVVLNDVGNSAQVVILTCQAERYASLGSADVIRLAAS